MKEKAEEGTREPETMVIFALKIISSQSTESTWYLKKDLVTVM